MNRRGGVGSLIAMIFAVVAIAIILTGFVFMSGVWKKFSEEPAGDVVFGEGEAEESFFNYTVNEYRLLGEVRFAVASGEAVNAAIAEVGYEK